MRKILLSNLSLSVLRELVNFQERPVGEYPWTQVAGRDLSSDERRQIQDIVSHLAHVETSLLNEATIWARAIYPLLVLAELEQFQAWSEVTVTAMLAHAELEGIVDGVIGKTISGCLETPYLLVLEAKRGLEGKNPRFQLLGAMLAAAQNNAQQHQRPDEEIFGCYTIGDDWTFLRATLTGLQTELPCMTVETSREYKEKLEAETIVKLVKKIVWQSAQRG